MALNRGFSYRKKQGGVQAPDFWVIPVKVAEAAQYEASSWGKVYLRHIAGHEQYRENWQLIQKFLELPT